MSNMPPSADAALESRASIFAALGDATRLSLIDRLQDGRPHSIARLTAGTRLTRQAVSKHLRVLEGAGVVRGARAGRESLFALQPGALADASDYLARASAQWNDALARLKTHVEAH